MNRENKKRKYDKKYFRRHPCTDAFICKECGWLVVPGGAGSGQRNHCPNCLYSVHLDNKPGDRSSECHGRMEPIGVWVRKTENGRLFTGAKFAGKLALIVSLLMITL